MVGVGGRLYVVGGAGSGLDLLVLEPAANRWSRRAPLPGPGDHIRAAAWRGEIWALGGRSDEPTKRVAVYDPSGDRWRAGPSLPEPMSAMAVGVMRDGLHVVGGEDPDVPDGRVIDAHYVLRPGARRWSPAPKPDVSVHGAGYGVWKGRLIVAGGAARQGLLSTISWSSVTQVFGG
jgi:N-acetylneuraminic acid mutarotase